MSIHIIGFKSEFFGYEEPDKSSVRVELENTDCVKDYTGNSCSGFEVDVTKLPKDVTIIRFFNAW